MKQYPEPLSVMVKPSASLVLAISISFGRPTKNNGYGSKSLFPSPPPQLIRKRRVNNGTIQCVVIRSVRTFTVNKYEIVETDLAAQKLRHIDFVSV